MESNMCVGCHSPVSDGAWSLVDVNNLLHVDPITQQGLADYIEATMPKGSVTDCDASCAADVAAYMWSFFNLMPNPGFEDGMTAGWYNWGAAGTIAVTSVQPRTGMYSLELSNRTGGDEPAAYNLTSLVTAGKTYTLSAAVGINVGTTSESGAPVNITQKISCDGEDDSYTWLDNSAAILDGTWEVLSGDIELPDCVLTELSVFAEGPIAGISILLDDISLTEKVVIESSNIMPNGDFEDGTVTGWSSWTGTNGFSATTSNVNSGTYSLEMTGRTVGDEPAAYNLTSLVATGTTYSLSMFIGLAGGAADTNITQKTACDGIDDSYDWPAGQNNIQDGQWIEFIGSIVVPDCTLTELLIYVEGPGADTNIYIDDVVISE